MINRKLKRKLEKLLFSNTIQSAINLEALRLIDELHTDIEKLKKQVFALRVDVDEIMELDDEDEWEWDVDVDDEACD